jgi:hypothetical protein
MGIKSLALLLQILGKADAVWRHVTEYVILANHLLMITTYSSIDIDKPLLLWHGPIYLALRQVTTIETVKDLVSECVGKHEPQFFSKHEKSYQCRPMCILYQHTLLIGSWILKVDT